MNAPVPARQQDPSQPNPSAVVTDYQIEIFLGNLLRVGVIISAAIVLFGAGIFLFRHGREIANFRSFRGEPSDFRTIPGVIRSALHGRGRGWMQLGLLCLIATPIARVTFSIVGFALERDRLYMAFTLIVLAVLLYSLLGSGLTL